MRIIFRLLCYDLPGQNNNIEIDIPEGSSVEDALMALKQLQSVTLPLEVLKNSLFHINDDVAMLGTLLIEGDRLTVLRTLAGG